MKMPDASAVSLLTLPHEILHNILSWVNPADLSPVSKTCHALADFVRRDTLLWKAVFLNTLVSFCPGRKSPDMLTPASSS